MIGMAVGRRRALQAVESLRLSLAKDKRNGENKDQTAVEREKRGVEVMR